MSALDEETITVTIAHYDPDILGIPGLYYDDGRVALFCGSYYHRLILPAGAREIIECIYARAAARRRESDQWLKIAARYPDDDPVAICHERPQRAWS